MNWKKYTLWATIGLAALVVASCRDAPSGPSAPCGWQVGSQVHENPSTGEKKVFITIEKKNEACQATCSETEDVGISINTEMKDGVRKYKYAISGGALDGTSGFVVSASEVKDLIDSVMIVYGYSDCPAWGSWYSAMETWIDNNWMSAADFYAEYDI